MILAAVAVLFDTTTLQARERSDSWSDAHERIFFPIGARFSSREASYGRIENRSIGPLSAYRVVSDPSVVQRSVAGIKAFDPEQFLLAMPLRGRTVIEQAGRLSVFDTGDLSSWDSSRPFRVTHVEPFDLLLLVVPRALLGPRRDSICHRTAQLIPHSSTIGALVAPFVRQVWEAQDRDGATAGQDDLADGLVALVRALHADGARESTSGSYLSGTVLLRRIKAYIDENLQVPALGPESVARANHVSTRYLHKLFEVEGVSVSEWIRHRRLEACRRELRDPTFAHETIAVVARRWGLSNPAHFSRIFRRAYGCTPAEFRRSNHRDFETPIFDA
jgi:AraC-like DNA-binding protein